MATYFDKVLYLFPNASGFSFWHSKLDGSPYANPYKGLVFDNPNFTPPTQATLDALSGPTVDAEMSRRAAMTAKANRDAQYLNDLTMIANFQAAQIVTPSLTFSAYLDTLQALAATLTAPTAPAEVAIAADITSSVPTAASMAALTPTPVTPTTGS
jgi:hypothetical protein